VEHFLPQARSIGDLQVLVPALTTAALVEYHRDEPLSALGLIEELAEATRDVDAFQAIEVVDAVRICASAGAVDFGEALLRAAETGMPPRRHCHLETGQALLSEARGELQAASSLYAKAAEGWTELGHVLERGLALLGLGRCELGLGRANEAAASLTEARAVFAELGARPLVAETDALLEEATARAS
jgi:hypothetical protein